MPKICFIHGVGNQKKGFSKPLSDMVGEETGAEITEHVWNHNAPVPEPWEIGSMEYFRGLTAELLMDFLRAVADYTRYNAAVPEADMYVGHSAGSIIIAGLDKPKVLMGSPLRLVYDEAVTNSALLENTGKIQGLACDEALAKIPLPKNTGKILNLVCREDIIAFKLPHDGYTNKVFNTPFWKPAARWIPLMAHTSYWDSKWCAKEISAWYKLHFPG